MQNTGNTIAEKFGKGRTVFSVEFFPPKTEEGARQILRTANRLKKVRPDFVSITYGAGGSSRERTLEYGELLGEIFGFEVMPHLACYGHSKSEIASILERFDSAGFRNVMALRGDKPKDGSVSAHPDGFAHADELVGFVREKFPHFGIGCAGYPEKHPEAPDMRADIANLKRKVDAGADFVTTQLFFDNSYYFRFVEMCRGVGIDKPIVAGLLPALSLKQLVNFKAMCSTDVPRALSERLEAAGESPDAQAAAGLEWAREQIDELLEAKVPGIHLYILNRAESALKLSEKFGGRGER